MWVIGAVGYKLQKPVQKVRDQRFQETAKQQLRRKVKNNFTAAQLFGADLK